VTLDVLFAVEAEEKVEAALAAVRRELDEWYFSAGESIEEVVGGLLMEHKRTLAVGESCTGGLLGGAITSVPGSSGFFLGGVTAYDNEVKRAVLKVRREVLDNVGAVSEPVAQQLALGVRALTGADYGLGVTGIAGPSGGTAEKPVGLVFICASSEEGDVVERYDFPGGREDVRAAAVRAALHMLHRKLLSDSG
jgi:nicotinamide-nucleotide amidase